MVDGAIFFAFVVMALEGVVAGLIYWLRQDCVWLITRRDRNPSINENGLNAFIEHGWDKDLGWVRRPNTVHDEKGRGNTHTSYSIGPDGARTNPGFEGRAFDLLAFGDSYTFARQVNDNETWPHQLSEMLNLNVANFGVGNYGLDQALLRLEQEFDASPVPVIIMGVVPETISRILSVWKHFSEYGNTFGFKPRFVLENGTLRLLPNPMDDKKKFFWISELMNRLVVDDYFFENKFSKDILHFPFLWTAGRNWKRTLPLLFAALTDRLNLTTDRAFVQVMKRNISMASDLYRNQEAVSLFKSICRRFIRFAESRGAEPVLVMMPQLMDLEHIRSGDHYYKSMLDDLSAEMTVVDAAPAILTNGDGDTLYTHDRYGGHLSVKGNRVLASLLEPVCRKILNGQNDELARGKVRG